MSKLPNLLMALVVAGFSLGAADPVTEAQARSRLTRIIDQMEKARFCQSGRCRYGDVRWRVTKSDKPERPFTGLIRAEILRPSKTVDKARYEFEFVGGRWQLMRGTETTDVNSASYVGDSYDFTSVYGRTPVEGKLTAPGNDLETGYKLLYLKIMDRGKEK